MIDSLNGEVLTIGLDHAVIECSGVGYRFLAAPRRSDVSPGARHAG